MTASIDLTMACRLVAAAAAASTAAVTLRVGVGGGGIIDYGVSVYTNLSIYT